jgi:chemosensory pili system protein ChpA (sensor histidine kinase/response regulator)
MSSEFDRKQLIDIFVLEVTDGMAILSKALGASTDKIPAPQPLAEQFIVAHRVRGAAALYGYGGVARLAERLETLLEQAPSALPSQWPQTVDYMRMLTETIQVLARAIGQGESEDESIVERCLTSQPGFVDSHQEGAPVPAAYVMPNLDSEVLAYFRPEADGYLDLIDHLIRSLRQNKNDHDAVDKLFRATHTLKGSAYTIEFQIIGDVAHPMEDCLMAIREQRCSLHDDVLDAMSKASGTIRCILQRDPAHVEHLQSSVAQLMRVLKRICGGQGEDLSTQTSQPLGTTVDSPLGRGGTVVSGAPSQISPPDRYLFPNLEEEVLAYFVPEAQEYLETLEGDLLRLEDNSYSRELIDQLFRTAHTLKGSSYTVGFRAIGDLIHHVEDFMGAVRDERRKVLPEHTNVILRSIDVIRALIQGDSGSAALTKQRFDAVQSELKQLAPSSGLSPLITSPSEQVLSAPDSLHLSTSEPQRQDHGTGGVAETREVVRVSHARLERLMNLVGELVIGRGRLEQRLRALEQLSRQVLVFKTRLGDSIEAFADKHMFTYQESLSHQSEPTIQELSGLADFGNLELDKYDDFNILARRIGEITDDISESMLQLDGSIRSAHDDMSQLQQLTLLMRDEIARARMVPIGTPFTRFRRTIRETAHALSKDVSLVTSGEQTEVDTGVVERLVDPLVHLVRNAVYHGIEPSAERVAKGKPAVGTIHLHAAHRGNSVILEIEDDGAGMDLEKIRTKAVKMGLVQSEHAAQMSDAQVLQLIFLPGFSTAEQVGDQAGRGVGLDVVKQTIASMNGHIDVESESGAGTKFTLHIPLTLLIATALLVRAGTDRYAIPLAGIVEVSIPTVSSLRQQNDQTFLEFENHSIPVHSLRHLLSHEQSVIDAMMPVVIVRMATGSIGLAVDELLGRQEIVIKPLGALKPFAQSAFGGATIDTEGRVVLVIDPSRLLSREPKISVTTALSSRRERHSEDVQPCNSKVNGTSDIRLLLVDDSLSIRKFVGKMLESAGYQVDTAVDGEDGFRKAAAMRYSLIITDLEMPKLNGFEVVQALRSRPDTKNTPVLVMTTRAGEKHHHMAMTVGATGYITKPVEERILLQEIERWVGRAPVVSR